MVTKTMTIKEVLTVCPDAAPIFLSLGMHCLGCAMASGETVEQAARAHGHDADELTAKLNAAVKD